MKSIRVQECNTESSTMHANAHADAESSDDDDAVQRERHSARLERRMLRQAHQQQLQIAMMDPDSKPLVPAVRFSLTAFAVLLCILGVALCRKEGAAALSHSSASWPTHSTPAHLEMRFALGDGNDTSNSNTTAADDSLLICPPTHTFPASFLNFAPDSVPTKTGSTALSMRVGQIALPGVGVLYLLLALGVLQMRFLDPWARWLSADRALSSRQGESMLLNLVGILPQMAIAIIGIEFTGRDVGFGTVIGAAASNLFFITAALAQFVPGTLPLAAGVILSASAKAAAANAGFVIFWYRATRDSFAFCVALLLLTATAISTHNSIEIVHVIPLLLGICLYIVIWRNSFALYQWAANGVNRATVVLNSVDPVLNPHVKLIAFLEGKLFSGFINLIIMLSVVCVVWDEISGPPWLVGLNYGFSAIFILECVVKHFALGVFGFWKEALNAFDGVLVALIIFEFIFSSGNIASSVRVVRLFRFLRALRGMRAIRVARGVTFKNGKIHFVRATSRRKQSQVPAGALKGPAAAAAAAAAAEAAEVVENARIAAAVHALHFTTTGSTDNLQPDLHDREHSISRVELTQLAQSQAHAHVGESKFSAIGSTEIAPPTFMAAPAAAGSTVAAPAPIASDAGDAAAPASPTARLRSNTGVTFNDAKIAEELSPRSSKPVVLAAGTNAISILAPSGMPSSAWGPSSVLSPVAASPSGYAGELSPASDGELQSPSGAGPLSVPTAAASDSDNNGLLHSPPAASRPAQADLRTPPPSSSVAARPMLMVHTDSFRGANNVGTPPSNLSQHQPQSNQIGTPVSVFLPIQRSDTERTTASGETVPITVPVPTRPRIQIRKGLAVASLDSPSDVAAAPGPASASLAAPSHSAVTATPKRVLAAVTPQFKRAEDIVELEEQKQRVAEEKYRKTEELLQHIHESLYGAAQTTDAASPAAAKKVTIQPGSRLLLQNRLHHVEPVESTPVLQSMPSLPSGIGQSELQHLPSLSLISPLPASPPVLQSGASQSNLSVPGSPLVVPASSPSPEPLATRPPSVFHPLPVSSDSAGAGAGVDQEAQDQVTAFLPDTSSSSVMLHPFTPPPATSPLTTTTTPRRGFQAPTPIGGSSSSNFYLQSLGLKTASPSPLQQQQSRHHLSPQPHSAIPTKPSSRRVSRSATAFQPTLSLPTMGESGGSAGGSRRGSRNMLPTATFAAVGGGAPSASPRPSIGEPAGGRHVRRVSTSIQLGGHRDMSMRPPRILLNSLQQIPNLAEISDSEAQRNSGEEEEDAAAAAARKQQPRPHRPSIQSNAPPGVPRKRSSLVHHASRATTDRGSPSDATQLTATTANGQSGTAPSPHTIVRFGGSSSDSELVAKPAPLIAGDKRAATHQSSQHTLRSAPSQADLESRSISPSHSDYGSEISSSSYNSSQYTSGSDYPSGDTEDFDSDDSSSDSENSSDASGQPQPVKRKRHLRAWSVMPRAYFHWRGRIAWTCLAIMSLIVIASIALQIMTSIDGGE